MQRLVITLIAAFSLLILVSTVNISASPSDITFSQSADTIDVYDFVEVTLKVEKPDAKNPFTDVRVEGQFQSSTTPTLVVDGFCDSQDGTIFRVRFMPSKPGEYSYSVIYKEQGFEKRYSGKFKARNANKRGLIRVDPQYPWHFIWEGTGEHYFWNGTTAYYLVGWNDDAVIRNAIDRLANLKTNRLRVLLYGRHVQSWGEPVQARDGLFTMLLSPWIAEKPDEPYSPNFNYSRFNIEHWRKYERLLTHARLKDMIITVIFDISSQIHVRPEALSEDEIRYFRYAVARLAAWSNITWDLGNEHNKYRKSPEWAEAIGPMVKRWDPYKHITSAHNVSYRKSTWSDMNLMQQWRRPLYKFMIRMRDEQEKAGRMIPLVLDEYGYEDHYPVWSDNYPNGQSADTNRRMAWEITMAGCYQTTGETARQGTGYHPNTGGGWINGRGDHTMVMLRGYAHMVDFFTSIEWWKMSPANDLINNQDAMCLAEKNRQYVVYMTKGGDVEVKLGDGLYKARWYNPREGYWINIGEVKGPVWKSPKTTDNGDWALLIERLGT
jgi:hypothetical protein